MDGRDQPIDPMDRLQAIIGEHEGELGFLLEKGEDAVPAVVRVFEDGPDCLRLDICREEGPALQLFIGYEKLVLRVADPQALPAPSRRKDDRPIWEDLEV